jgi:hypothetical protein
VAFSNEACLMNNLRDFRVGRRALLAAAPAACLGAAACSKAEPPNIRRVVTTQEGEGPVQVLADGPPPVAFQLNGSTITRLWETPRVPAPLPLAADATLSAGRAYDEGFIGTSFYLSDIPPGSSIEDIPMHRNQTVDYIAVLFGEVVLVLPDDELILRPGDCLVQGGNDHTWVNRSDQTSRLLVVVVTGSVAAAPG